jgi:hypothetical protein
LKLFSSSPIAPPADLLQIRKNNGEPSVTKDGSPINYSKLKIFYIKGSAKRIVCFEKAPAKKGEFIGEPLFEKYGSPINIPIILDF